MVRYYIIFEGRVQGVGFRWTLMSKAQNLGLTGWVHNRDDGRVETQIQGDRQLIHQLLNSFDESRFILIEDYVIKEIEPEEYESGFSVR